MTPRLLIADDEPDFLFLYKAFLKDQPCEVETTTSGLEAYHLLSQKHFHLAVLDLKMPDLSGMSVLCEAKKKNIPTNIIILTGFSTVEMAVHAMQFGAVDVVQKPIQKPDFIAVIKKHLPQSSCWGDRFEKYLLQNHKDPNLSLHNLLQHFNLSRSYASALFKHHLKTSFQKCLRQIRIERAKEQLSCAQEPLSTIAMACGFKSQQRLYDAFMAKEKMSPSQFRQNNQTYAVMNAIDDLI